MNKKNCLYTCLNILLFALIVSCHKDDSGVSSKTLSVNKWIKETMEAYYFWNDRLPVINYTEEKDPEAYFYKLLYTNLDKWSYITDDYSTLSSELTGEPLSMGYEPAFYLYGTKNVFIVVKYVYPDSPAEEAGLKRGNIILSINNTMLDTLNYYRLFTGTSYSVQLGKVVNKTLTPTGQSLNMAARVLDADPAIYHKIFNINGKKIGYLAYVGFVAGDQNRYLNTLNSIFTGFKSEGISDLIVDLRYNPGGDGSAAVYLASEIAPADVVNSKSVLEELVYNSELEQYLISKNKTDYLYYYFQTGTANIDMDRVYFLTTSGSASASELVISGLDPYMDVIQIGEATYGKYAGMWVIPDENNEWALMPIVLKYANANGYTDFIDGLQPDYEIKDDLVEALPLGDSLDPMTAKALELASGITINLKTTKSSGIRDFKPVVPHAMVLRKNLFVDLPGELQ